MKIFPLSEGSFTIDKTKQFVPFDDQTDQLEERSAGSLLVEIQPFVLITSKDVLLIDTGLGFADDGAVLHLHRNMRDLGIEPASVTKVLMSHLHKDHAGAVSEERDRGQLSFPNATWYVQERELKHALEKGSPSYIPEEFQVLKEAPHVEFLQADSGTIDGYIDYRVTGAHSLFHQVFWIRENDETVFFGADDAPQLSQMKRRFAAKYDLDGKKAMELRKEWWERGEAEKWTFLFYHDIKTPVYRFE